MMSLISWPKAELQIDFGLGGDIVGAKLGPLHVDHPVGENQLRGPCLEPDGVVGWCGGCDGRW